MGDVSESLTKWFSERPQWLQIAATRLLQQSAFSVRRKFQRGDVKATRPRMLSKFDFMEATTLSFEMFQRDAKF